MTTPDGRLSRIVIRPLREDDLPAADLVMRTAFGTWAGAPEPATYLGDETWVQHRFKAAPEAAFAADADGELVGSSFATLWGSFGTLGPLTVRPDAWDHGIGGRLIDPVLDLFARRRVRLAGLYTYANSPKHAGLYEKYGFRPRYLTAIMAKAVGPAPPAVRWDPYSRLSESDGPSVLDATRRLTDALFAGLDASAEIRSIRASALGETVLLRDGSELDGFAACHGGPGTEAGSGVCFVKFAAVGPSPDAAHRFARLLAACESHAAACGATRIVAGVSTARREAYAQLLARGFRIHSLGVAMHRPDDPGFSRAGIYVLDDWR